MLRREIVRIARRSRLLPGTLLACLLTACSGSGSGPDATATQDPGAAGAPTGRASQGTSTGIRTGPAAEPTGPRAVFAPLASDLIEPADIYRTDGYEVADVIRVDLRTRTQPGACTADDESGCTLADVLSDIDRTDDIKIDIPVHMVATDFPDDGLWSNAQLRQRGGTTRLAAQKSFRIELDKTVATWRDERKLQLNKHPYEATRTRNKLAMGLLADIPYLMSFRTQLVNLWIDDGAGPSDHGLFTHVEAPGNRWLERRGLDRGDNLYKANRFTFSSDDLKSLRVDAQGEPLDAERFERALEIESGSDHRALVHMLEAVNDPDVDFEHTLDTHFNRNNVMAWMVANVLLHQTDATSHNLVLHNPKGSDRFYFVPWDYDGTFALEQEPANATDDVALRKRLRYGFARSVTNEFIARWLARPGVHARMVEAAAILRQHWLSDARIEQRATALSALANAYLERTPDSLHNPTYYDRSYQAFAGTVAGNEAALADGFSVPMPPRLLEPVHSGEQVRIAWTPAIEVTGERLSYELSIASDPDFSDASVLFERRGIDQASRELDVPAASIGRGPRYVRLIARAERQPERFWQVSLNSAETASGNRPGTLAITAR